MNSLGLNLPLDIPWKLISVSRDMMDTTPNNRQFPFAWRPSIAIFLFEPKLEDLPEEMGNERITFIKIACSITGYQASPEETEAAFVAFANVPTEEMERVTFDYLGCYGVLLNVAIFPRGSSGVSTSDYPHIMNFEPKVRDLYQSTSQEGEILTASSSEVNTDKTMSTVKSTETGISAEAAYKMGPLEAKAKLSHTWGTRETDSSQLQTDSSRDRRERIGSTTNISQLYNIVTGYHVGTNRATFLMLPRPHTLQTTDRRTFVPGVRAIEGVQEFFLVVSRPRSMGGICIEARLETGHFPEDVARTAPMPTDAPETRPFIATAYAPGGLLGGGDRKQLETLDSCRYEVEAGWIIDRTQGDAGHAGMSFVSDESNARARESLRAYNYRAISDSVAQVFGEIEGSGWSGPPANFTRTYNVWVRRTAPVTPPPAPRVTTRVLTTSRSLFTCYSSTDAQVETTFVPATITSERNVQFGTQPGTDLSGLSFNRLDPRDVIQKMRSAMTSNWRIPEAYSKSGLSLVETDYFRDKLAEVLPPDRKNEQVDCSKLPADVAKKLNLKTTVGEILAMDLSSLANTLQVTVTQAANFRRDMLGIPNPKQALQPTDQPPEPSKPE